MAAKAEASKGWGSIHRYCRIAPRKARLVMDTIRGKRCAEAVDLLRFDRHRAAHFIRRVLKTAMSNADEAEANMTALFVAEARVDGGPYYRRWNPKDRGRAHPIAKRTSHLIVRLQERA